MSDLEKKTADRKLSNKLIALGTAIFLVIEAVLGFFVVLKPLFIDSVYHNAYLDEHGYTYTVSFFGNLFASEAEKASGTVMLSLSGQVVNLALIYLVMTLLPLAFVLLLKKGFAFAKTGLLATFGAKTVIGLVPLLVPFSNVSNAIRIFGAADSVVCLAACALFVYLNNAEYAEDMAFTGDEIKEMVKRAKFGGFMFLLMAVLAVCEKFAMAGYGDNRSIMIGKDDQQLTQGYILVALVACALICSILYIRDNLASMYYFAGFGGAVALTNVYALTHKSVLKNGKALIFVIACVLIGGAAAVFAITKVKRKLFAKPAQDEKKPALITMICSAALIVCFVLSVIGVLTWDKRLYSTFYFGAMDYMYLIAYGGVTLFLAFAMMGGCGFAKWGALALYIVVGASNFTTVFKVLSARKAFIAGRPGITGHAYFPPAILLGLSVLCCFTIIAMFVYKEISSYMYNKSNQ